MRESEQTDHVPAASNASASEHAARNLAWHGAAVFLGAMLYGGVISAIMTDRLPGRVDVALSAHMNGLLGGLWCWGAGWSLQYGKFSPRALAAITWGTIIPSWANFVITAFKVHTDAGGVGFDGGPASDAIFAGRLLFVVAPGLIGGLALVMGLKRTAG